MSTSQSYEDIIPEETPEEKQAREGRLRVAEISRRFTEIDRERIRPLAAIAAGTATDEDRDKLTALEDEAKRLRTELAGLEVNHE